MREVLRQEGKNIYIHKIVLSRNPESVFSLAEKKPCMNLGEWRLGGVLQGITLLCNYRSCIHINKLHLKISREKVCLLV